MSTRLQILMEEEELEDLRAHARERGLTLSEYVRQTLREAGRHRAGGGVDRKIASIRAALRHSFPAPDIETMLDEIESGYRGDGS